MKRILTFLTFTVLLSNGYTQRINGDYKAGAINIALPKTPESTAFEKYGNIPVNEVTGTALINIPVYTLKSRFMELPISVSYNTSGIKVNQEASWVGLGFDLVAGGRITVDVKGTIDNDSISSFLYSPQLLAYGMEKLFHRLGDSSNAAILTFASTCQGCDTSVTQDIPDHWESINAMAQYGLGEPDIFHANFLGQSLKFYFDKITGNLKFLGEKSLVSIAPTFGSNARISSWTITDNMGVKYYFNQKENTALSMPSYGGLYGTSSTTAWLLTKMLHPSGDSIVLTYASYGNSYPAFSWSASKDYLAGASNDADQIYVIQTPMYLTKIESNTTTVDFILGSRQDLRGTGSKRLNEIRVSDKLTSTVRKKTTFSYDYFTASQVTCYTNSLHDSLENYSLLRLRLKKLYLDDSAALIAPYQFFYYNGGTATDKYSFSQDHWGFYNGQNSNSTCSPQELLPAITNEVGTSALPQYTDYLAFISGSSNLDANRNCDSALMPTMTLDSIIYPTGGSSKMIYEPHDGGGGPVGGGLRIKSITNYSLSQFASRREYTYSGGVFMGNIRYQVVSQQLPRCSDDYPTTAKIKGIVFSNGYSNDHDFVTAYSVVTITQRDKMGQTNGYVQKIFNVPNPRTTYASNNGFFVQQAHWPTTAPYQNSPDKLYASLSGLPPTPVGQLDGKLLQELYYKNDSTLVKSVHYYMRQAESTKNFYSVKATDNRIGGSDAYGCPIGHTNFESSPDGARRYTVFVSPAKSYFTVTDSIIEKTYQGGNAMTVKKTFSYNNYFQPEFQTTINSDGTQTITHTKTYLSFRDNAIATGDYQFYGQIISEHIYDLPLEQTRIIRKTSGDSVVTASTYSAYEGSTIRKMYNLESSSLLNFRSQFVPLYRAFGNFVIDSRYRLHDSAGYTASKFVKDALTIAGRTAFVWDSITNTLLAKCDNAPSGEIAFTSFETPATGGWVYSGTPVADITAPTGQKRYGLATGNVTKSGLNAAKTYVVSYWSKNGSQNVNSTSSITGMAINGWTYYQHKITGSSSVTISGTGIIDELRLYPFGSLMTSYTYQPLAGLTSQCDINNRISYYEYDVLNRLTAVRDQDKNVLKRICYNYAGQPENCMSYANTAQSGNFTRNNCGSDYIGGTVTYTVPAGTHFSTVSQSHADSLATADVNANGQTYANTNGSCTCNPIMCAAPSKQCIYNQCYTGELKCVSSVYNSRTGLWTCTYRYVFSIDCSSNFSHTTTSATSCPVDPPCH